MENKIKLDLRGQHLYMTNMSAMKLDNVNLNSSIMPLADFSKSSIENSSMVACNLTWGDFYHCSLKGSDLSLSCFENANFENANLEGCNLKGSNLKNVNFKGANLKKVCFDDCVMDNADLTDADVLGATVVGVNLNTFDSDIAKNSISLHLDI